MLQLSKFSIDKGNPLWIIFLIKELILNLSDYYIIFCGIWKGRES